MAVKTLSLKIKANVNECKQHMLYLTMALIIENIAKITCN